MDENKKNQINQKAEEYLRDYIDKVNLHVDDFFLKQKNIAQKISPIALDMVQRYEKFIGGKRLRGALTRLGYEIFGGSNANDILKASAIVEFIHSFALVHDDIMDEDDLRRKQPTIHKQYEALYEKEYHTSKRNKKLFGTSMAIDLGDLGPFYSNIIVSETNFDPQTKINFLRKISEIIVQTIYGQGLDVSYEQELKPTYNKVMEIHQYKTSYYTIPGPLQYGAVLAGVDLIGSNYSAIEKYGIPVGIAFQLRDDELGMFSTPEKLGKPIYSDLRQGKNTILFAKAFEKASKSQLDFLNKTYGNPNVTEKDLADVNQILIDTGAVEFSNNMSWELVNEGKKYITKITSDKKHQDLLDMLADYVVTRNS